MQAGKLIITVNPQAVDAYLFTKDRALELYSRTMGVPLERIGYVGDDSNDKPVLSTRGLGFPSTVSNGTGDVKDMVRNLPRGYVSGEPYFSGFKDCRRKGWERGITHFVTDKDGVLVKEGDLSAGPEFCAFMETAGTEGPFMAVLTASGYYENRGFMDAFGLNAGLSGNPAIRNNPYALLAENGVVMVNVLTGEKKVALEGVDERMLRKLKGDFTYEAMKRVQKEMLNKFGLGWSHVYEEQTGTIFVPQKEAMVTLNIPRKSKDGADGYRKTEEAETLRRGIGRIFAETAERLGMPYEML